nr:hypothetical protein [Nitrosopumilus sp.]
MENNNNNNHSFFKDIKNKMSLLLAFKIVYYSNPFFYIGISVLVFIIFWIVFNVFDQLLFFSPILYFYLPNDAIIGFIFTNISAFLLGIVVSMNIYLIKNLKLRLDKSLISGSFLGIASSACASCSSIGFLIISSFGGAGIVATAFLTNYQLPLRLLSIGIMIWALYD